jgi:hypothetical protein
MPWMRRVTNDRIAEIDTFADRGTLAQSAIER